MQAYASWNLSTVSITVTVPVAISVMVSATIIAIAISISITVTVTVTVFTITISVTVAIGTRGAGCVTRWRWRAGSRLELDTSRCSTSAARGIVSRDGGRRTGVHLTTSANVIERLASLGLVQELLDAKEIVLGLLLEGHGARALHVVVGAVGTRESTVRSEAAGRSELLELVVANLVGVALLGSVDLRRRAAMEEWLVEHVVGCGKKAHA